MRTDYFAYGANIDVPAMRRRCPTAICQGTALLHEHKPAAMREGWLTVSTEPGWVTPGLLWSLESADIDALDEYEGVETGLYVKKRRTVLRSSDSNPVEVMVYLGRNSGPGTLHEEYAYRVAAAIRRELSMMKKISDRTAELIESLSKQEKARED
jgi:hypothetical protein